MDLNVKQKAIIADAMFANDAPPAIKEAVENLILVLKLHDVDLTESLSEYEDTNLSFKQMIKLQYEVESLNQDIHDSNTALSNAEDHIDNLTRTLGRHGGFDL